PGRLAHRLVGQGAGEYPCRMWTSRLRRKPTVFEHRERQEDVCLLVAAPDPHPRSPIGAEAADILSLVENMTARWSQVTREQVDHRRFAGAVGAEHGMQLTAMNIDRDII